MTMRAMSKEKVKSRNKVSVGEPSEGSLSGRKSTSEKQNGTEQIENICVNLDGVEQILAQNLSLFGTYLMTVSSKLWGVQVSINEV